MGNLQVFQSKTKKRRIATYLTKCSSEKPEAISSYVEKYGVNVKGAANDSPLSFAAQAVRLALYKKTSILNIEALINIEGNVEMVNFLLSKGANINTKNSLGNTPLLCAVFQGHAEVVRVLLSHGASVDAANQFKNTPLTWTAIRGHFGIARLLVGYGADVNLKAQDGQTALHWATILKRKDMVKYLISRGAMLKRNRAGETPMNLTRDESVKKLLEQARPMQRLTQLCLRVIQKNEKQFADVRGDLKKSGLWSQVCEQDYYLDLPEHDDAPQQSFGTMEEITFVKNQPSNHRYPQGIIDDILVALNDDVMNQNDYDSWSDDEY